MKKPSPTIRLQNAIHLLEIEKSFREQQFKSQFQNAYTSIKPANLIKSAIKDITKSPNLVNNIIGTTVGIATGYLSKKIVIGTSANLFRKLFGSLLQLGVTTVIAKHPEAIKSIGKYIIDKLPLKKSTNSEKQ
jgi:hypothetical protein